MSGGIRPRTERQAFYRSMSSGMGQYGKVGADELLQPSRWSGNIAAHGQSVPCSKEEMMQEIQRTVFKSMAPYTALLHKVLEEIQELRGETIRITEYFLKQNELKTSCQAVRAERNAETYSSTEPKSLLHVNTETGDNQYEDFGKLDVKNSQAHSVENHANGGIERTTGAISYCNDSGREKKERQHNPYDNVVFLQDTKPKEFRSNSLQTRVKSVAVQPRPRSAVLVNRASCDERECLANALQFHIEDLVDGVVFHESELPDCLLTEGCLTEDECATVRRLHDRKDQIRVLLSLIKGRDLRVLKGFMIHIRQHNPDVAEKINKKFELNKSEGLRGKLCVLCKLTKQFNVKHVADSLWAIEAIKDELYNKIIYSEAPIGAQSELWKEVIFSLNSLDKKNADIAQRKLIHALSSKNLFTHLASGINMMLIKNHGMLMCNCEPKLILPSRNSFWGTGNSGESFIPDSSSDSTSNDLTSHDGTENGDMHDWRHMDTVDGMPIISEEPVTPTNNQPDEKTTNKIDGDEEKCDDLNTNMPLFSHRPNFERERVNQTAQMTVLKKPVIPTKPSSVNTYKPPVPAKKPERVQNSVKASSM